MKYGDMKFKLSKKSIENYKAKYHHPILFQTVNGCYNASYYKEYRTIQKEIVKQLVESLGLTYDRKKFSTNMDLHYTDEIEKVEIRWSAWIPRIEICITASHRFTFNETRWIELENKNIDPELYLFAR